MKFTDEFEALKIALSSAVPRHFCSGKQSQALTGLITAEFNSREERLIFLGMLVGRVLDTSAELTAGEASLLISYFKEPYGWVISENGAKLITDVLERKMEDELELDFEIQVEGEDDEDSDSEDLEEVEDVLGS